MFAADAGIMVKYIRPDKKADFEATIAKLKEALDRTDNPERRRQAATWRVFRALESATNGDVIPLAVERRFLDRHHDNAGFSPHHRMAGHSFAPVPFGQRVRRRPRLEQRAYLVRYWFCAGHAMMTARTVMKSPQVHGRDWLVIRSRTKE
jgi:hypothetical protein